jgi:hypothetical protein
MDKFPLIKFCTITNRNIMCKSNLNLLCEKAKLSEKQKNEIIEYCERIRRSSRKTKIENDHVYFGLQFRDFGPVIDSFKLKLSTPLPKFIAVASEQILEDRMLRPENLDDTPEKGHLSSTAESEVSLPGDGTNLISNPAYNRKIIMESTDNSVVIYDPKFLPDEFTAARLTAFEQLVSDHLKHQLNLYSELIALDPKIFDHILNQIMKQVLKERLFGLDSNSKGIYTSEYEALIKRTNSSAFTEVTLTKEVVKLATTADRNFIFSKLKYLTVRNLEKMAPFLLVFQKIKTKTSNNFTMKTNIDMLLGENPTLGSGGLDVEEGLGFLKLGKKVAATVAATVTTAAGVVVTLNAAVGLGLNIDDVTARFLPGGKGYFTRKIIEHDIGMSQETYDKDYARVKDKEESKPKV